MIKADLVESISGKVEYNRPKAEVAVESLLQLMKDALKDGGRIELRGFGVFLVRSKKTGVGRNPKTNEQVAIRPGRVVKFKPSKEMLLDAVAAPEL